MNEGDLALFLDSFERCVQNDRFIKVFYDIFLGSSEEIPAFFTRTDFSRQRRILKSSLYDMVAASARRAADLSALSMLTQRHRELKIQPHHYELWMQSLISAAAECDPHFNPEVGRVWRDAFQAGIDYMKASSRPH
jgi:hemoglobin-like flavoprotein